MKKTLAFSIIASLFVAGAAAGRAATAAENWDNHCTKCHAADGSGSTKIGKKLHVKDYSDAAVQAELKDDQLFAAIKDGVTADGKERMKAFKDELTDPEITDLVAYIRKLKK